MRMIERRDATAAAVVLVNLMNMESAFCMIRCGSGPA